MNALAAAARRLHCATRGWKTHAVALSFVGIALVGYRAGMLTGPEAIGRIEEALLGSTLRSALANRPC